MRLLAQIDRLHGTLSGPATKKLAQRAFTMYPQPQYETFAAFVIARKHAKTTINRCFTWIDARIKLKHLYPSISH